jgi:hypothetical protein
MGNGRWDQSRIVQRRGIDEKGALPERERQ